MIIYLKNGSKIETDDEFVSCKTTPTGNIIDINWNRKPGKTSLYYIDPAEVAAVIDIAPKKLEDK